MICATGPGQQRLDVGRVGELRVGHDRRRVRVDQDDLVALLAQDLAGLHAGVVELGGLADDDRAGAEEHDLVDVVAPSGTDGLQEAVELVERVVRAGPGLGVVLDRRGLDLEQLQPLDGAVVEVDVRQRGGAEVGVPAHRLVGVEPLRAARALDREAVVLRRDLDPPRPQVLDRVVGAAVAEGQLVGLQADRLAEQLVAEADAPDRALADQLADGVDDVAQRRRVARAVGQEERVGVGGQQLLGARPCTGAASPRRRASTRLRTIERLMPVSIAWILVAPPCAVDGRLGRGVTTRARSGPPSAARRRSARCASPSAIARREHAAAHRAGVADVADERARVDAADRRDAAVGQPVQPAALGRRARPRG